MHWKPSLWHKDKAKGKKCPYKCNAKLVKSYRGWMVVVVFRQSTDTPRTSVGAGAFYKVDYLLKSYTTSIENDTPFTPLVKVKQSLG